RGGTIYAYVPTGGAVTATVTGGTTVVDARLVGTGGAGGIANGATGTLGAAGTNGTNGNFYRYPQLSTSLGLPVGLYPSINSLSSLLPQAPLAGNFENNRASIWTALPTDQSALRSELIALGEESADLIEEEVQGVVIGQGGSIEPERSQSASKGQVLTGAATINRSLKGYLSKPTTSAVLHQRGLKQIGETTYNLETGKALLAPKTAITIKMGETLVKVAAGALVVVAREADGGNVLNLSDGHAGAVCVEHKGHKVPLYIGNQFAWTTGGADFKQTPLAHIAVRNLKAEQVEGDDVYLSEFSLISALRKESLVTNLMSTSEPERKKLFTRVLTNVLLLQQLAPQGKPYSI
ncbi:MAG TPA: hypothetical protein PL112_20270, partial [Candidatus Obscuribacter sp.]|nr:hypothetical protein [Candidatus Obscuribacter sp.]